MQEIKMMTNIIRINLTKGFTDGVNNRTLPVKEMNIKYNAALFTHK